jgi:hypothetical protein
MTWPVYFEKYMTLDRLEELIVENIKTTAIV